MNGKRFKDHQMTCRRLMLSFMIFVMTMVCLFPSVGMADDSVIETETGIISDEEYADAILTGEYDEQTVEDAGQAGEEVGQTAEAEKNEPEQSCDISDAENGLMETQEDEPASSEDASENIQNDIESAEPAVIPEPVAAIEKPLTAYTIKYYLNGGTNAAENPATYTVEDDVVLAPPVRAGYTFRGWYRDSKLKQAVEEIVAGTTGNKTFYAKWTANVYTLIYDGNGAVNTEEYRQSFAYGTTKELTKLKYSRPGYKFTGWNTQADGSGTGYKNCQKVVNLAEADGTEIRLYAQWSIIPYTLTYALNKGTNAAENPATYTVEDDVVLAPPVRAGYTFRGWFTDSRFKSPIDSIPKGSIGNRVIYAKWTANHYTFVFEGNGADDGVNTYSQNASADQMGKLAKNAYVKEKYSFIGWNTEPDGSGTKYENLQNMQNFFAEDGTEITLYAQWIPNLKSAEFNGTEYNILNTAADIVDFSKMTYRQVCQVPDGVDPNKYHDLCLKFSHYYVACLNNGILDPTLKDAARGVCGGCSFREQTFSSLEGMMKKLYQLLNTGKPQILMVQATNHKSRHFIVVVGYKKSVTDANSITPEDLLILDTHDGQLESMDPAIFSDNTRLVHKQDGRYRLEIFC